jgi:PAS domain S-box-containing protein
LPNRLFEQLHLLGLGLALILVVSVALLSYFCWRQYVLSADETRRTNAIMHTAGNMLFDLERAALLHTHYRVSGDPTLVAEYRQARALVENRMQFIFVSRGDEYASSPAFVSAYKKAVEDRLASLDAWMQKTPRPPAPPTLADIGMERALEARVVELSKQFQLHQHARLDRNRNLTHYYARLSQLGATLGCLGIFLVVLFTIYRIQNLINIRGKLNEELSQSAEDLRHLTNSLPQLILKMTAAGEVEYLNQRWAEFGGPAILETRHWRDLLHPKDRENFLSKLEASLRERVTFTAECRLRKTRSDRYAWLLFRSSPSRDETSEELNWYGTFTDITQLKITERALQRANKDLEQFAYAAAHDLQEPLRNVALGLSLVQRMAGDSLEEEAGRLLAENIVDAKRMHSMLRDLLAFSTAVQETHVSYPLVDSASCLSEALANLNTAIQESGATISHNGLPAVKAERIHLIQLFQNLVGNSPKYRKPDLPVAVQVSAKESEDDEWIFSVSDNGIGFRPEYAEQIFGVFKRLHGRGKYSGSGIGLAICARIIAHYGGRIWAESELNEGATFFFSLPRQDAADSVEAR